MAQNRVKVLRALAIIAILMMMIAPVSAQSASDRKSVV